MRRAILKQVVCSVERSWFGRRFPTRFVHASAPLPATQAAADRWPASRTQVQQVDSVPFPSEGRGLSFELNWALAARGIPPLGKAYQNLKDENLKEEHNACVPDPTSVSIVYACGAFSSGAIDMGKEQFSQLLKDVKLHLSSVPNLFIHDGCIGASASTCVEVCTISDDPSATLVLANILNQAQETRVSPKPCSLTVYVASKYSPLPDKESDLYLDTESGFVGVDYDSSSLILGGKAFTDSSTVKSVLAALAAPVFISHHALPLAARLLVQGESTVLVFVSDDVLERNQAILESAVSSSLGVVWSTEGVATLFTNTESNLYKDVSSLVLLTLDSSGAVPEIAKLTHAQAALQFLAGLSEDFFNPGYESGPAGVNPVYLATGLFSKLAETNIPSFIINAKHELMGLIGATVSEKLPKSKSKKPSEAALEAHKKKYSEYMSRKFPDLPKELEIFGDDHKTMLKGTLI